jgi:UTP--glucose-1-phosphate uridylyltransferase
MATPRFPAGNPAIRKAVIPAAGLGSRLRPLTDALAKELLPVGRKPVLAHIAAELRGAGITDALLIISDRKPQIRAYFGDEAAGDDAGALPPLKFTYAVQERQRGLGDALLYAEEWAAGSPFVVAFGDCMIEASDPSSPLRRLLAAHAREQPAATVLAEEVAPAMVSRYGVLAPELRAVADPGAAFRVTDIVEKPSPERAPSRMVVAARWVLESSIFRFLKETGPDQAGEIGLTGAVRAMLRAGHAVWAAPLLEGERRCDIGNFETFFNAFIRAAMRDTEFGASACRTVSEELERTRAAR